MQSTHADTTPLTLAPAASPTAVKGGFDFMGLMPLALIFVVFYFLVFRPQQQKAKQQKSMIEALQRGDSVVTEGGLIGVIHRVVSDKELALEIADAVVIRIVRSSVAEVISKTGTTTSEVKKEVAKEEKSSSIKANSKKNSVKSKNK